MGLGKILKSDRIACIEINGIGSALLGWSLVTSIRGASGTWLAQQFELHNFVVRSPTIWRKALKEGRDISMTRRIGVVGHAIGRLVAPGALLAIDAAAIYCAAKCADRMR